MYVIREKFGVSDLVAIFVRPWITMLAFGALGHRLNIPYLFRFGYWEVFLLVIAASIVRGSGVSKYEVKEEK